MSYNIKWSLACISVLGWNSFTSLNMPVTFLPCSAVRSMRVFQPEQVVPPHEYEQDPRVFLRHPSRRGSPANRGTKKK